MDKSLKVAIVFSILIISFSIFYYLVIYIPHREQQKIDIQKQSELQKKKILEDEEQQKIANTILLNSCLSDAETNASDYWNKICLARGEAIDCGLPSNNSKQVDDSRKEAKADCFKKFPQ